MVDVVDCCGYDGGQELQGGQSILEGKEGRRGGGGWRGGGGGGVRKRREKERRREKGGGIV